MKNYRAVRVIVSTLLVLAVLAGSWHSAAAAFIDENHYSQGRTGIFVPAGLDPNNMQATKLNRSEIGWGPVKGTRAVRIETQFQGGEQTVPTSMTYVFFNLRGRELRDWQNDNLNIYYQDPNTGNWATCNAFLVGGAQGQGQQTQQTEGQQNQDQQGENGDDQGNRLACVAPAWNTVYVLGTVRPGFENRLQQQTTNQDAEGQAQGGTSP